MAFSPQQASMLDKILLACYTKKETTKKSNLQEVFMGIRKASTDDLAAVLAIYKRAREFMRQTGNPTQWKDSYPPEETVRKDIDTGHLFVWEQKGKLHGVFAFFREGDPVYDALPVSWLNQLPYAAIHRVASAGTQKGMLGACVDFCLSVCPNLKIDTHKENTVMQSALIKQGFTPCGTVNIPNVGERIVYQRSDYDEK